MIGVQAAGRKMAGGPVLKGDGALKMESDRWKENDAKWAGALDRIEAAVRERLSEAERPGWVLRVERGPGKFSPVNVLDAPTLCRLAGVWATPFYRNGHTGLLRIGGQSYSKRLYEKGGGVPVDEAVSALFDCLAFVMDAEEDRRAAEDAFKAQADVLEQLPVLFRALPGGGTGVVRLLLKPDWMTVRYADLPAVVEKLRELAALLREA